MATKKSSSNDAALSWLADHEAVRAHCKQFKIEQRLEQGGGIARITGFLPDHVAEACNAMVGGLSTSAWEPMCNEEEDGGSSVIEHNFSFAEPEDHPETLGLLADAVGTPHSQPAGSGHASTHAKRADAYLTPCTRQVALLFPALRPSFSVAAYGRGDCIHPHDDKAHVMLTDASLDGASSGAETLHSRKYAGVLYLSKGWKSAWGGALVDLELESEMVPAYNSLVVFEARLLGLGLGLGSGSGSGLGSVLALGLGLG